MHSQLTSSMADLHPGAVTITESPTQSPRASIASHALQILVTLNEAIKLVKVTIKRSGL